MKDRIYVKPAPGVLTRNPVTRAQVPPEGAWLVDSRLVRRRIADGGLIECESPAAEPESAPETDDQPRKRKHAERFSADSEG